MKEAVEMTYATTEENNQSSWKIRMHYYILPQWLTTDNFNMKSCRGFFFLKLHI